MALIKNGVSSRVDPSVDKRVRTRAVSVVVLLSQATITKSLKVPAHALTNTAGINSQSEKKFFSKVTSYSPVSWRTTDKIPLFETVSSNNPRGPVIPLANELTLP